MINFRLAFIVTTIIAMQSASLDCPALAADLGGFKDTAPMVEAVPIWDGFYFGGHAGGVWSAPKATDVYSYIGDPTINSRLSGVGFIGGAQAGYNFQRGHFVFGPEADIGYLNVSASKSFFQPGEAAICQIEYSDEHWVTHYNPDTCNVAGKYSLSSGLYGDITARIGYEINRTLFYAKGGLALLDVEFKANYIAGNCTTSVDGCANWAGVYPTTPAYSIFNFKHSDTLLGWTAGGGVEYALNASWSLKAEYQHFDFGKMSYSYYGCKGLPLPPGTPGTDYAVGSGTCPASASDPEHHYTSVLRGKTEVEITADAVKVGINYHLNNEGAQK
jgi:outer membrane immunogenic protein